eukprot:GILJ01005235.1.p1 GENE.GILJ01005235.1~~GILJ01005235.1.p1  ORF type:complete len:236 (-),score=20.01 GILJ01005235.1:265-933(-)
MTATQPALALSLQALSAAALAIQDKSTPQLTKSAAVLHIMDALIGCSSEQQMESLCPFIYSDGLMRELLQLAKSDVLHCALVIRLFTCLSIHSAAVRFIVFHGVLEMLFALMKSRNREIVYSVLVLLVRVLSRREHIKLFVAKGGVRGICQLLPSSPISHRFILLQVLSSLSLSKHAGPQLCEQNLVETLYSMADALDPSTESMCLNLCNSMLSNLKIWCRH